LIHVRKTLTHEQIREYERWKSKHERDLERNKVVLKNRAAKLPKEKIFWEKEAEKREQVNKVRVLHQTIPSLEVTEKVYNTGDAPFEPQLMYTGDKMLGVACLHKSSLVPVFSEEEVLDISKMRR
jgi:hypothetical protein